MITSRIKEAVIIGLLVGLSCGVAGGASQAGADLLGVVPAESVFCLRVNNFEYTINQIDQFLAGLSPVPLGLSMMVRMQFAGILGDPQLGGVDMNGTFGAFGLPMPGSMGPDPNENIFVGILVPVTDYNAFLAGPNVSQPDAQGISQITVQGVPVMAVKQAGRFALVTGMAYYDMLATVADSIASGRSATLASVPGLADGDVAGAPVWAYIDAKALAPLLSAQISGGGAMPGGTEPPTPYGTEPTGPGAAAPMPMMMGMDFAAMADDLPVQSVTLGLTPSANVLTIMVDITALPGTELAQTFVRGSAGLQEMFDAIGAKAPGLMGAEMSVISNLLPQAGRADVVGTYDLMQLVSLAAVVPMPLPIELPQIAAPSKSGIAYAVAADSGKMTIDIAVPKEHVAEIIASFKDAGPGDTTEAGFDDITMDELVVEEDDPNDEISMITSSPFGDLPQTEPGEVTVPVVETDTSLFGDTFGDAADSAVERNIAEENVRVAGARLVRYSDLKLGVLPLGRGDGYTLSLVADLPSPVVKVSGGRVVKAVTNTGASLLPEKDWDRNVKFPRLSRDYKTAVFDIELLLPDQGVLGLEELAGTLEYLTASGTRDVDLGVVALEPDAKGSQLGAKISSIVVDPYQNNATVVGLTLDVDPEIIESVELFGENDERLELSRRGHISLGNTTTVKLSVEGELPAKARIVVRIFEGLEKNQLTFRITGISLAGQPMQ